MMRQTSIPLPLAGLLLALVLGVYQALMTAKSPDPLLQVGFVVLVMTVGVVSIILLLMPRRRMAYLLGFLVCAALMGWAFWLQYRQGLEPCPLCMFQRVAVVAAGLIFLVAFLTNPGRRGAAFYAALIAIAAGIGAFFAGRQLWLQSLPKDQVPSCGMGLNYMLDTMPLADVIGKVLSGSGECAEKSWELLGLSIAGWTMVFFLAMIVAAFLLIRRE